MSLCFSTMSATAYRGVAYDAEARQLNQLALIKKQLQKIERSHEAAIARAKVAS